MHICAHNADLDVLIDMKFAALRRWVGHVVHMGEMRSAFNFLTPEGKRPYERPRHRWQG